MADISRLLKKCTLIKNKVETVINSMKAKERYLKTITLIKNISLWQMAPADNKQSLL